MKETFVVFSSGLMAQIILFALTLIYAEIFKPSYNIYGICFYNTFTFINLILIISNIIPYKTENDTLNDGYVLWKLFLHVVKNDPHPLATPNIVSKFLPPETSLLNLKQFRPKNFTAGIEILNDDTTPMEFVVEILTNHLNLSKQKAIEIMLEIHKEGGVLLPLPSIESAKAIAQKINSESQENQFHLICRAVDSQNHPESGAIG